MQGDIDPGLPVKVKQKRRIHTVRPGEGGRHKPRARTQTDIRHRARTEGVKDPRCRGERRNDNLQSLRRRSTGQTHSGLTICRRPDSTSGERPASVNPKPRITASACRLT